MEMGGGGETKPARRPGAGTGPAAVVFHLSDVDETGQSDGLDDGNRQKLLRVIGSCCTTTGGTQKKK